MAGICQEKLLSYLMFRYEDLGTVRLRAANPGSGNYIITGSGLFP